jgi:hypothetical protein
MGGADPSENVGRLREGTDALICGILGWYRRHEGERAIAAA